MAGGESAENVLCYFCKSKAVTKRVKCENCSTFFHNSCAAKTNKKCCENPVLKGEKPKNNQGKIDLEDDEFFDAGRMDDVICNKDVEIKYLKLLVAEMTSKNKLLEENQALLKEKIKKYEEREKNKNKEKHGNTGNGKGQVSPPDGLAAGNSGRSDSSKGVYRSLIPNIEKPMNDTEPSTTNKNEADRSSILKSVNPRDGQIVDNSTLNNQSISTEGEVKSSNSSDLGTEAIVPWTEVRSRRTKGQRVRTRPEHILGTNKTTDVLQIAQNLYWIFITGLSKTTTAENILQFLKSHQLEDKCVCEVMSTKTNKSSSFKLGVPMELREKYMDPELWPEGLKFNHFRNMKRPQTNQSIPSRGPAHPAGY